MVRPELVISSWTDAWKANPAWFLSRKSLRRNCNCWCFLITTLLSSWGHWPHKELTRELESIKIACVYKSPFLQSIRTTTQILLTLKFFLKYYRGKQDDCNYKFFLGRIVRLLLFLLKQIFTKHFVSNWFLVKVQIKASILMDYWSQTWKPRAAPSAKAMGRHSP